MVVNEISLSLFSFSHNRHGIKSCSILVGEQRYVIFWAFLLYIPKTVVSTG